jgi:hypothetical protein
MTLIPFARPVLSQPSPASHGDDGRERSAHGVEYDPSAPEPQSGGGRTDRDVLQLGAHKPAVVPQISGSGGLGARGALNAALERWRAAVEGRAAKSRSG